LRRILIGLIFLIDVSKCNLTEQNQGDIVNFGGETIISAFGDHISKVYTLSEHIPGGGGLKGCNFKPLGHDANIIGQSGSMPQEHLIAYNNGKSYQHPPYTQPPSNLS